MFCISYRNGYDKIFSTIAIDDHNSLFVIETTDLIFSNELSSYHETLLSFLCDIEPLISFQDVRLRLNSTTNYSHLQYHIFHRSNNLSLSNNQSTMNEGHLSPFRRNRNQIKSFPRTMWFTDTNSYNWPERQSWMLYKFTTAHLQTKYRLWNR
jgi:hypothetical protein